MDGSTLDLLLCKALLADVADGLESISARLSGLFEAWRSADVDDSALEFLGEILGELGWWSGRAEAAAGHAASSAAGVR